GLESADLIKALLLVQFIGFPAAIAFGFAGEKIGPLRGIAICLCVYLGVTVYAYFLSSATEFFIMAAVIGLVQGGVQALSRSYYARLVPPENSAEYFGFFNMIGKFSSVLGPLMVGWVGLLFNDSRAGILILAIFFVLGGGLLFKSRRAERAA
nr:MFS transporter [Bdellovibrionales bacterium]